MKKIKLIFSAILITGVFSCSDDILQLPNDRLTPETFYQTTSDFDSAARALYSGMMAGGYYGGSMLSRPDIMSDNLIIAQRGRRSNQVFYQWNYAEPSAWNLMFNGYLVTNRANRIIEQLDNLPEGAERNNFEAEARAIRAFCMFDMLRVYSQAPTQSANALQTLGMTINTGTDPFFQEIRPTAQESYDFVVEELEAARSLMTENSRVTRMSLDGINALLSRVYLYLGEYELAVARANNVTKAVAPRNQFADVWTDSGNAGVILKLDQDRNLDGITLGVEYSQSSDTGIIPEYVLDFEFSQLFQPNDIRTTAYTFIAADDEGQVYNAVRKYLGEQGQQNGIVDAKLIRAAEVQLNKAEALARLGQDGPALQALDLVRSNRYLNFTSGNETGSALLQEILKERRIELAFEGHRFFDLKRLNLPVERSNNGDFFDGTGTPPQSNLLNLPAGNFRFQMAIPQRERNIFPELQQNPGYSAD